jgi:hypothetical protein
MVDGTALSISRKAASVPAVERWWRPDATNQIRADGIDQTFTSTSGSMVAPCVTRTTASSQAL